MLHREILSEAQGQLVPLLRRFSDQFGLVGGTAVALHIGHRESIDFDLFTKDPDAEFDPVRIRSRIRRIKLMGRPIRSNEIELTFDTVSGVKMTFFQFPFAIPYTMPIEQAKQSIMMPDLLTLAAMKAFALGRRAKWKDYADLYFIMRDFYPLPEIVRRADELFGGEFNEKLLRIQLASFDDINYTETVVYKPGFEISDETVKEALVEQALGA